MELKFVPFCSSRDALSDGTLFFAEVKIFRFRPKTMDYNPWFCFSESEKSFENSIPP